MTEDARLYCGKCKIDFDPDVVDEHGQVLDKTCPECGTDRSVVIIEEETL